MVIRKDILTDSSNNKDRSVARHNKGRLKVCISKDNLVDNYIKVH